MATLASLVEAHEDQILNAYLEYVYERVPRYKRDQPGTFPANTRRLIQLLPTALDDPDSPAVADLVSTLVQQRLPAGFQLTEILQAMFYYFDVILPVIWQHGGTTAEQHQLTTDLDQAVSAIALRFARAFVDLQLELIEKQRQAVLELSTPVIKVWDGILALPLIGTVDSYRARQIMEELLKSVAAEQAAIVLIDITGVPVVDTNVADHLIRTIRAAELLGTQCLLVGIGPVLAQTLVGLGIDLSDITSCADMRQGLTLAFQRLGLAVTSQKAR